MKKLFPYFLFPFLLLSGTAFSMSTNSCMPTPSADSTIQSNTQAMDVLMLRLAEIKEMDKSALSSSEKKQLRQEKRAIQSAIRDGYGGVYLSVGAIIIIVLLLILLL